MKVLLLTALVFAQEPSPKINTEKVQQEKGMVTAQLRTLLKPNESAIVGKPQSIILTMTNNGTTLAKDSIGAETVKTKIKNPDGTLEDMNISWSSSLLQLEPNMSFSMVGYLQFAAPGDYEIQFWWTPDRTAASKTPDQILSISVK